MKDCYYLLVIEIETAAAEIVIIVIMHAAINAVNSGIHHWIVNKWSHKYQELSSSDIKGNNYGQIT